MGGQGTSSKGSLSERVMWHSAQCEISTSVTMTGGEGRVETERHNTALSSDGFSSLRMLCWKLKPRLWIYPLFRITQTKAAVRKLRSGLKEDNRGREGWRQLLTSNLKLLY